MIETISVNDILVVISICYTLYGLEFISWWYWVCNRGSNNDIIMMRHLPIVVIRVVLYSNIISHAFLYPGELCCNRYLVVMILMLQSLAIPYIFYYIWKRWSKHGSTIITILTTFALYYIMIGV